MIDYLLIDFTYKAYFPETLIYTASFLHNRRIRNLELIKIQTTEQIDRLIADKTNNLEHDATILLWQQDWLSSGGGYLLIDCAERLKGMMPECTLIVGGYLPTMSPELYINESYIDVVLCGYPWASDEWIEADKNKIIQCTHDRVLPDELSLEIGLQYVEDKPSLFKTTSSGKTKTSYFASYHCNNKCPFCFNSRFVDYGGGIVKSMDRIQSELEYLTQILGVSVIESKDNNIFVNKPNGQDVLRTIADYPDLMFDGNIDIMVHDFSETNIDLLSRAGVNYVFFGLESFDPDIRKRLNKDYSDTHLEEIFDYGSRKGVFFMGNLLLGVDNSKNNPLAAVDVDRELRSLWEMLDRHDNLAIQMRLFMPLLGTPLGNKIWDDTHGREELDIGRYLRLIDTFVFSKSFDREMVLPSHFESVGVYNYAARVSRALRAINVMKKERFLRRKKGASTKKQHSEQWCKYQRFLFEKALYRIVNFNDYMYDMVKMKSK